MQGKLAYYFLHFGQRLLVTKLAFSIRWHPLLMLDFCELPFERLAHLPLIPYDLS